MKNLLSIVLLVTTTLFATQSFASFPKSAQGSALLYRANVSSPLEGIGTVVDRTKNLLVAVYDVAVLGGATGTINLVDDQGNAAILPLGANVTNVVASSLTSVSATGGTGTLALRLLASTDLMNATLFSNLAAPGFDAGNPVGTAASWVGPVTAAFGTQLKVVITDNVITAGKVKYFIEYVIQ